MSRSPSNGDGSQTRAFCYIDDLIDGLVRLMRTPDDVTGPVNLGNPAEVLVRTLAETILRMTGSRSKLAFEPLPQDDPRQRCPDIGRARKLLGWQPGVPLESGLERTIAYFRDSESVRPAVLVPAHGADQVLLAQ